MRTRHAFLRGEVITVIGNTRRQYIRFMSIGASVAISIIAATFVITSTSAQDENQSANVGFVLFSTDRDNPSTDVLCANCEEIYAMDVDGTGPIRLTNNNSNDKAPVWSHGTATIAFHTNRRIGRPEIFLMDADGSNQRLLASRGTDGASFASFNHDGSRVCFMSQTAPQEIWIVNIDGSGMTNVTNNSAGDIRCDWSPKYDLIAFVSNRDGNQEIYSMQSDGSNVVRLTSDPGIDSAPDWSPDGDRIVFESDRDGNSEIYVMNADGSNLVRLTFSAEADNKPSWSPKGDKIAFHRRIAEHGQIITMNADGTDQTQITFTPDPGFSGFPTWAKGKLN